MTETDGKIFVFCFSQQILCIADFVISVGEVAAQLFYPQKYYGFTLCLELARITNYSHRLCSKLPPTLDIDFDLRGYGLGPFINSRKN